MVRIIARLDSKPPYLIKPIQFDGLRKLGLTKDFSINYYKDGADEIMYIDSVASLFNNYINFDEVRSVSQGLFVPLSVGGGVRNLNDFINLLHHGADKVVLNTHAFKNPNLISEASSICGSQSVVVHIEAKKIGNNYECYTDCGRIPTGIDVLSWAKKVENLGAGEIIISSIDNDGMRSGFDTNLVKLLTNNLNIPIVASSGAGTLEHILEVIEVAKPDAVAIASLLHYKKHSIKEIKSFLFHRGIGVNYEEK
jgi:imidazole glycerol-phosphate synthase subunit HisF